MTNKQASKELQKSYDIMMRDCTPEEQESIDKYIKSISKPTGINFWDLDDNDDCISRKAVLSILADHFDNPFDRVRELPPVAISYDRDLISRQDLIVALSKWWFSTNEDEYNVYELYDAIHKVIKDMPSVAIPNKVGHWIRWYEQKDFGLYIENIPHCKCSECGKEYDSHSSQFIKYCNECGARMVEPQESEEQE